MKNLLIRALVQALVGTSALAAFAVTVDAADADPRPDRPVAPESPEFVLGQHDETCWRGGESPLADLPGHAIVQWRNGRTVYTARPRVVDHAFREALSQSGSGPHHDDPAITTIAMCI